MIRVNEHYLDKLKCIIDKALNYLNEFINKQKKKELLFFIKIPTHTLKNERTIKSVKTNCLGTISVIGSYLLK